MQIIVDSLLTEYTCNGAGKTVLIIPGWADTAVSWQPVAHELSKHYKVIVLNIPGFGGTQAPSVAWGLRDYAQFVAHFIDKLGEPNIYALIGHSNGGAIAIKGAGEGLLQPDRLVLLASAGVRARQQGKKMLLKYVAKTGKVATFALPAAVRQKLRKKLYAGIGSDLLVAPHMQETFKRVVSEDIQPDARQVTVPTLLVYGELDTATPVAYGELLHQAIEGSTFERIGGVGHFLHTEQPERVARIIEEYIA